MNKKNKSHDIIMSHMKTTREAFEDGSIDDLRSINLDKYDLIEVEYSFGKRKCLKAKEKNDYLLIQKSRCGSVNLEEHVTISENLEFAKSKIDDILDIDEIRIEEVDLLIKEKLVNIPEESVFSELGFRTAKLLNFYNKNRNMKSFGFDVIQSNIEVANCLGYETFLYDFNDCLEDLNLKNSDLVVSYHMLEHVTYPLKAIKKIFSAMKANSYFHVEIPIEPYGPNIRYCHMYPFHPKDLYYMLQLAGFEILTYSGKVAKNGPMSERYMAIKPKKTYVFDIDGTVCTQVEDGDYLKATPYKQRIMKINELYDQGHDIIFNTARGMGRHNNQAEKAIKDFYSLTYEQLKSWDIKFHNLYLGKPSGDEYIDDKGIKDENFFNPEN